MKSKILYFETYIKFIKNSIGSKSFRNLFVIIGKRKKDILNNGELSCAFFVSFVLKYFDLIKNGHVTVSGLIRDMESSGWEKIPKSLIKEGNIIVWNSKRGHKHIGFYIGKNEAISTNTKKKIVFRHHFTFGGRRNIYSVYRNRKIDKSRT